MTHRELCELGAKYMYRNGTIPFNKPKYVVCELERIGECPDVFGFGFAYTQLLEIKVSRSDFLSDKKKEWRINPEIGLGQYRSYLCPENLIKENELPDNWGLFYINDNGKISMIKKPERQISCSIAEVNLAASIMRRELIKPQIFSYKKYKVNTQENEKDKV